MTIDSLGFDFGTSEAPLRMIEFFDYGCGFCRAFHQETRGPLHEEYVEPGQVLWKSIPFVIGRWPASVPVSLAAECARRPRAGLLRVDLHPHLPNTRVTGNRPPPLRSWRKRYAEEVGLDMERYRTCVEGNELLWRVQAQTEFAEQIGVRGTPTFLLVGWGPIMGSLPLETFRQLIDTVLVEAAAEQL